MNGYEKRGPLRLLSQIVSLLFHPALMPVYGLMIIFNAPTILIYIPINIKRVIILLAVVNMTLVPIAMLPFFKYRNIISSFSLGEAGDRVMPLALGLMMYIITTVIFYSYQIPVLIKSFMLSASVTAFIVLIVTLKWKISIHSAGMGGLLATVLALSLRMGVSLSLYITTLIVISGLVMASRLFLGVHNSKQVYWGFAAGFIPFIVIMVLFG